jgi:diacylglycerol O-acyltransferase
MRQLTGLDAQFLGMENNRIHGHVSLLVRLDPTTAPAGVFDRDVLCSLVEARLHLLEPFRLKLATVPFGLDHPYWVEDRDFDLDFHIRDLGVAPPGTQQQLCDVVGRLVSRPLDRSRPLWEAYVVHGLSDGSVALLTKIHHAAVDGISGAEILSVLLDLDQQGRQVPPAPGRSHESLPSEWGLVARALLKMPKHPLRALSKLPSVLPGIDHVAPLRSLPGVRTVARQSRRARALLTTGQEGDLLERSDLPAPRTIFNDPLSPHRTAAYTSLPLSQVKLVKDRWGVTVNDVVMALCAMAVRKRLLAMDALPEGPLLAMVPVSVRTAEQLGTYGNRISNMVVAVPTDKAEPKEALQDAHAVMSSAKTEHRALPATLLQDAAQFVPPALASRASRAVLKLLSASGADPGCNLIISNVPGAPFPMYCAGAKVLGTYPISILFDGVGLNITVLSYQDSLDVGVVACREQGVDLWALCEELRVSLDELLALA